MKKNSGVLEDGDDASKDLPSNQPKNPSMLQRAETLRNTHASNIFFAGAKRPFFVLTAIAAMAFTSLLIGGIKTQTQRLRS